MTIEQAFDKYAVLDELLSDPKWMEGDPGTCRPICHELWLAIKEELEK